MMNMPNLDAIKKLLINKEQQLLKRRLELNREDPFNDPDRLNDNAAIDTDAAEQFGHENILAMRKEVDVMLVRIKKALSLIKIGKYGICENCKKFIDTKRLVINPTASYCVNCEVERSRNSE